MRCAVPSFHYKQAGICLLAGSLLMALPALSAKPHRGQTPNINFFETDDGVAGLKATAVLEGTTEQAWQVLTDSEKGASLFDNVRAIAKGSGPVWIYRLSSPIGEKKVICTVSRDEDTRRIAWKRTAGDLDVFEGSFTVSAAVGKPGKILVTYISVIDPGLIGRLLFTQNRRATNVKKMFTRLQKLIKSLTN